MYIYLHMIQKKPRYKKVRYACIYLVLSATDQAKAVGEVTQNVRETTSEVSEQEVGETTVNPGKDKCKGQYFHDMNYPKLTSSSCLVAVGSTEFSAFKG